MIRCGFTSTIRRKLQIIITNKLNHVGHKTSIEQHRIEEIRKSGNMVHNVDTKLSQTTAAGRISALLFVANAIIQMSRAMVPSMLPAITADKTFALGSEQLAVLLPAVSMTCLLGKLALGPATDYFGGSKILVACFIILAGVSLGLMTTTDVHVFGAAWILNA